MFTHRELVRRTAVLSSLLLASVVAGAGAQNRPDDPAAIRAQDVVLEQRVAEANAALARATARRAQPSAAAARARSRSAGRRLDDEQALTMLRGTFARQIAPKATSPVTGGGGGVVRRYLDDHTAVVEERGPDGAFNAIVDSSTPIRTDAGEGADNPVDTRLVANGEGFKPRADLVSVRLPSQLQDGVSVGGGIVVTPIVPGAGATARRWEDALAYPNVAADTDAVVKPLTSGTGAELYFQVRSPDAPEIYALDTSLPAGTTMREADGAVEFVRDGEVVGLMRPPVAEDADGADVPVTASIDGGRVVLEMRHRAGDVRYPVLLDPIYDGYSWTGSGSNSAAAYGWGWWSNRQYDGGMRQYFWYGLGHTGPASTAWLNHGDKSEWYYNAWTGARIFRANFTNVTASDNPNGTECHYTGVWSREGNSWSGNSPAVVCGSHGNWSPQMCPYDCNGGGSDYNMATFGVLANNGGYRNSGSYAVAMSGATIGLRDTTIPTITPYRSNYPIVTEPDSLGSVNFKVADNGFGIGKVVVSNASTGAVLERREPLHGGCAGTVRNPCPATYNTNSINLDSLNLPYDQWTTIRVSAWDFQGVHGDYSSSNFASYDWYIYRARDTTAPVITPSDELWTNSTSTTFNHRARLGISATDAGVGVRKITVYVNDVLQPDVKEVTSCAGGRCPLTHEWYLDYHDLDLDGSENYLEIRATDFNGNWTPKRWRILVDEPAPGGLADAPSDPVPTTGTLAAPVGMQECDEPGTESAECTVVPNETVVQEFRASSTSDRHPALLPGGAGWGIGDEHPRVFAAAPFNELRPRVVRKIIFWDMLMRHAGYPRTDGVPTGARHYRCQSNKTGNHNPSLGIVDADNFSLPEFEEWLRNALPDGLTPQREVMISIGASRKKEGRCYLPTRAEYRREVSLIMDHVKKVLGAKADQVKYWNAWNEPNHASQPTSTSKNKRRFDGKRPGPIMAGRYYRELYRECREAARTCVAAAGEFVDDISLSRKADERRPETFWGMYLRGVGDRPADGGSDFSKYWALHAYNTGDQQSYALLKEYIRILRNEQNSGVQVWLTEQGGRRQIYKTDKAAQGLKDLKGILNIPCKIGSLTDHVTKLLIYQMLPSTQFGGKDNPWDSAIAEDQSITAESPARAEDAVKRQPDWDYVNDAMNVGANTCPLTI